MKRRALLKTGLAALTFTVTGFGWKGAPAELKPIDCWKWVDELNGVIEYTGNEPFDGYITFDFDLRHPQPGPVMTVESRR